MKKVSCIRIVTVVLFVEHFVCTSKVGDFVRSATVVRSHFTNVIIRPLAWAVPEAKRQCCFRWSAMCLGTGRLAWVEVEVARSDVS